MGEEREIQRAYRDGEKVFMNSGEEMNERKEEVFEYEEEEGEDA